MRYKNLLVLCTIGFSAIILWLYFINKLTLYVHPRYTLFTIALAAISIVLLLPSLFESSENPPTRFNIVVCLLVICATIFPAVSLTARTAENRSQSNQVSRSSKSLTSYDMFNQDFGYFDVADLSAFLANKPTPEQIIDKKASIEGFLFEDSTGQKFIARFKLSCCAVDATPLTVPVLNGPLIDDRWPGSWYKVTGVFRLNDQNESAHPYALEIEEITGISEPEEPYVY